MNKEKENRKKYIERKAIKIINLEKQLRMDESNEFIQQEIENIMSTLSIEDMLEIDEYIVKKKLLNS